jgi:hypothetical protein
MSILDKQKNIEEVENVIGIVFNTPKDENTFFSQFVCESSKGVSNPIIGTPLRILSIDNEVMSILDTQKNIESKEIIPEENTQMVYTLKCDDYYGQRCCILTDNGLTVFTTPMFNFFNGLISFGVLQSSLYDYYSDDQIAWFYKKLERLEDNFSEERLREFSKTCHEYFGL